MNMTETNALTGQVGKLHSEIHKIAETIVVLYNMQKAIDQKASVIGKALIAQKAKTEQVTDNQKEIEGYIQANKQYSYEKYQKTAATVSDVNAAIGQLRSLEERENTLLASMEKLSKKQTQFISFNVAATKTAERELDTVKTTVEDIRSALTHMNITDQVAFMNSKAVDIQKALASYVSARIKTASVVEQRTKKMEERILEMQGAITEQKKSVDSIVEICKACEEKTVMMCDKLETLLAQSSKIIADKGDMSLEDMFGTQPEKSNSKRLDGDISSSASKIDQTTTSYNFTMPNYTQDASAGMSDEEEIDLDALLASTQTEEVDSLDKLVNINFDGETDNTRTTDSIATEEPVETGLSVQGQDIQVIQEMDSNMEGGKPTKFLNWLFGGRRI